MMRRVMHSMYAPQRRDFMHTAMNPVTKKIGGVLKSMLASDIAIIDIEEHQIEYLKVVIELFREAAGFSNGST